MLTNTMWPVLIRELQAEARHSFSYWLRVLGAAAMLLAGTYEVLEAGLVGNRGGPLFARLHLALFCSIWILVPLMTADCISRERREGTLGLLFLTPLNARAIVLAKGLAHGLRGMTLCLAVLPVLMIPFLMGGVGWQEGILSLETNLSSFCWALAAGLLASSWTKVWLRALCLTMTLAVLFCLIFAILNCFVIASAFIQYVPTLRWSTVRTDEFTAAAFFVATDWAATWKEMFAPLSKAGQSAILCAGGIVAVLSLATIVLALQVAARNVRLGWQEEPPSVRRLWWSGPSARPCCGKAFFESGCDGS